VSYIIQVVLSMFSWLSVCLVSIVRNDTKEHALKPHHQDEHDPPTKMVAISTRFLRLACLRVSDAASTLLVELQEAQCFFIIAISVAQLYASSQDPAFSEADSPASLIFQYNRVMGLSAIGMQCIALTQAGLRHARLDSLYSLVWATLAASLAGAAGSGLLWAQAELVQSVFREDDTGVEECGGTITLRDMCVDLADRMDTSVSFQNASLFVMGTFFLLWSKKITPMILRTEWVRKQASGCIWLHDTALDKARHCASASTTLILALLELVLFSFTLISCIEKQKPSKTLTNGSWTIGQIMAMLIWAPVISKHLYLVICEYPVITYLLRQEARD
jgi:hypothetical protein